MCIKCAIDVLAKHFRTGMKVGIDMPLSKIQEVPTATLRHNITVSFIFDASAAS